MNERISSENDCHVGWMSKNGCAIKRNAGSLFKVGRKLLSISVGTVSTVEVLENNFVRYCYIPNTFFLQWYDCRNTSLLLPGFVSLCQKLYYWNITNIIETPKKSENISTTSEALKNFDFNYESSKNWTILSNETLKNTHKRWISLKRCLSKHFHSIINGRIYPFTYVVISHTDELQQLQMFPMLCNYWYFGSRIGCGVKKTTEKN